MRPADCDIVLVRPSRAGNVGAACRAMKNMGFSRLVLVGAQANIFGEEARSQAWQAWDVLEGASTSGTLLEAVSGSTLVVGTSGKTEGWTPRRFAEEGDRLARGRVSLVFGPEASGLTREEMDVCHLVVRIPTDVAQPSLNLAQAVLIVAYEILVSGKSTSEEERAPRATVGEMEVVLSSLARGLEAIGYLNSQNPGPILSELRALLVRAQVTPREVALLAGMGRQILWASEQIARTRAGKG